VAHKQQLDILLKGVNTWNKWREENCFTAVDLSRADLSQLKLRGVNLSEADLTGANMSKSELSQTKLLAADLVSEYIIRSNLSNANLRGANLSSANLSNSDLHEADLSQADLSNVDLSRTDLRNVELVRADLTNANLSEANLSEANLSEANLSEANFFRANLVGTNLSNANLTGANLYGTARDDWNIQNIKCEYVFFDEARQQRCPKDRKFGLDEFEVLYKQLPTIDYIFENGMSPIDPLIMDRVVQAIRDKKPEFDIKIDSINARGLAPSIRFTVCHEEHKDMALAEVSQGYEEKIDALQKDKERLYKLLGKAIDKGGTRYITGEIVAMDNVTVNLEQHISQVMNLQRIIAEYPEDDKKTFGVVAKQAALEIVGEAAKDIAKGQVTKAAKEIVELCKALGPLIAKSGAYAFFKSMIP